MNAASGGLIDVADNIGTVEASGSVRAEIGQNLGIQSAGGVTVKAYADPEVDADVKGVSAGGIFSISLSSVSSRDEDAVSPVSSIS